MLFNEIYRHVKKSLASKKLVEAITKASNQSSMMFEPQPSAAFLLGSLLCGCSCRAPDLTLAMFGCAESDVSTEQHKQTLRCLTQVLLSLRISRCHSRALVFVLGVV